MNVSKHRTHVNFRYKKRGSVLPVGPGPLVERGCACGAVLAAQSGRARHVVIGHHWGLHWLQGLVGSVTPG